MSNRSLFYKFLSALIVFCFGVQHSQAQLGNILKKTKAKLEQKADDAIDKTISGDTKTSTTANTSETGSTTKKRVLMSAESDFKAGDSVIYASNFEQSGTGTMPKSWKTNGSGQLVKSQDVAGIWLELQAGATYKLAQNYKLPTKFTVEFDLLTSCDKITDIFPVRFGFAENNSVSGYDEGDIAHTELEFYNGNGIISFAKPVDKHINTAYDLTRYANDKLHVSIAINGDQMRVYLDNAKVLDTKMFKDDVRKYLFISAPFQAKNDAKVYVSNIVIAQ